MHLSQTRYLWSYYGVQSIKDPRRQIRVLSWDVDTVWERRVRLRSCLPHLRPNWQRLLEWSIETSLFHYQLRLSFQSALRATPVPVRTQQRMNSCRLFQINSRVQIGPFFHLHILPTVMNKSSFTMENLLNVPPSPQDLFRIMQFWANFGLKAPLVSKLRWAPALSFNGTRSDLGGGVRMCSDFFQMIWKKQIGAQFLWCSTELWQCILPHFFFPKRFCCQFWIQRASKGYQLWLLLCCYLGQQWIWAKTIQTPQQMESR